MVDGTGRIGDFVSPITDSKKTRLGLPPAHREIQISIPVDHDVGDGHRAARQERLEGRRVTRPLRLQVNGIDLPRRPIAREQRPLIPGRKTSAGSKNQAGRRPEPDIDHAADTVRVVFRPLSVGHPTSGVIAPAIFPSRNHMVDASGPVPGLADACLAVCIVGEQLALGVERHVVGVPETTGNQLPERTRFVRTGHPAGRHESRLGGNQQIVGPIAERRSGRQPVRNLGAVARNNIDETVGAEHRGVGTVLTMPVLVVHGLQALQQLDLVEPIIAVRIQHPVEAAALSHLLLGGPVQVDRHVETVVGVEKPLGMADGKIQLLDLCDGISVSQCHPVKTPELIRGDQTPRGIRRQGDPGALFLQRHRIDQIHLESLRRLKLPGNFQKARIVGCVGVSLLGIDPANFGTKRKSRTR